jgi:hypothetical protein
LRAAEQVPLLRGAGGPPGGLGKGRACLVGRSGHLQQVPAHGEQPMVTRYPLVAVQGCEQVQPRVRSLNHRHCQRAVQGGHRVRRDAVEELVQRQNLRPVGLLRTGRFVVDGGDGRLELVGAHGSVGQGVGDEGDALRDGVAVPAAAILVGERHELAVSGDAGRAAGLGEQHQGQQALDLTVGRAEPAQVAG